jgi:hypothetical protein
MLNEALILVTRNVNVTFSRVQKVNRIVGELVNAALKLHRRFGPTRILPLLVRTFASLPEFFLRLHGLLSGWVFPERTLEVDP